jgi:hypothetical protein
VTVVAISNPNLNESNVDIEQDQAVSVFSKYRVFHKGLTHVEFPIKYDPTISGKCDGSLTTSYQDVGLGKRDQAFGLPSHPTEPTRLLPGLCQGTRLHSATTKYS